MIISILCCQFILNSYLELEFPYTLKTTITSKWSLTDVQSCLLCSLLSCALPTKSYHWLILLQNQEETNYKLSHNTLLTHSLFVVRMLRYGVGRTHGISFVSPGMSKGTSIGLNTSGGMTSQTEGSLVPLDPVRSTGEFQPV